MLPPTLTRFHGALAIALLLSALAWLSHNKTLLVAVLAALLITTALGVILPQLRWFGPFVCHGSASRKWVALTFDDGPDALSTPPLLDTLQAAGVQATFFCVGKRVAAHPELAARIVREGHLLQNHSFNHSHTTNLFTVKRLQSELDQTQNIIRQATGITPQWFRPPMGLSNPRVFRVARTLGLTVVGWTARGLDTQRTHPKPIVDRITRRLKPGAIILLHDGGIPADRLVPTVTLLLDTLQTLGYDVVRLDRMLT